ncbi:hypothetical protein [Methylobacterium platani]|uniref:CBS domain-containing protein n=2 Tax=Methylobacterium platani TaxID=427683 RepID=A0A179SCJ7_9HYPH|nr:hypothetical protein [Methylobacterium platani]KMO17285.1 hypothetical protein SQ03_12760 [Methylobacterium platani JCM 14648]OAS25589.1 hypothetical protein A5481_09590 [Methylobacterium platani]
MSPARIAAPDGPATALVPALADGRTHAVVVTGPDRRVVGIVTQPDTLATLARAATAQALLPS